MGEGEEVVLRRLSVGDTVCAGGMAVAEGRPVSAGLAGPLAMALSFLLSVLAMSRPKVPMRR